jgi:hypothetical protein
MKKWEGCICANDMRNLCCQICHSCGGKLKSVISYYWVCPVCTKQPLLSDYPNLTNRIYKEQSDGA